MSPMTQWRKYSALVLGVSVQVKIMGIALGLVLLLGLGVTARVSSTLGADFTRAMREIGASPSGRFRGPSPANKQQGTSGATERLVDAVSREILLATLIASIIGLLAAYFLTRVLTGPLLELRAVARRVATGQFDARARFWFRDEIGQLTEAFNGMTESLQLMEHELQQKEAIRRRLLDKLILAQEEERKRVARELHDETSQALTSLMVGLKVLEDTKTLEEAQNQITELRAVASRTLDEVHRLALELRPAVLDDYGLAAALERYIRDFGAKAGLEVDSQVVGLDGQRLPFRVETTVYRVVQEALTNIARHANARHVSVVLKHGTSSVLAVIEDDGDGFEVEKVMANGPREGRLGLYGMQERASLLGGKLTIESTIGTGTTLFVELPNT